MAMYVDYDFYINRYGGSMGEENFLKSESLAESHIRAMTYIRGDIFAKEETAVKMALCAASDILFDFYKDESGSMSGIITKKTIASENNDGFSVTYAAASSSKSKEEELNSSLMAAVKKYLQ